MPAATRGPGLPRMEGKEEVREGEGEGERVRE